MLFDVAGGIEGIVEILSPAVLFELVYDIAVFVGDEDNVPGFIVVED